jgi:hypothetical protein
METASIQREIAKLNGLIELIKAETHKSVAIISEPVPVRDIVAKGQLRVAELNAETQVTLTQLRKQGEAESDKIRRQAKAYANLKYAQASEAVRENNAKALQFYSDAEAYAQKLLEAKREWERRLKCLGVIKGLTESDKDIILTEGSLGSVQAQMLACV